MSDAFDSLAEQIAHRRVIVVAGAGVAKNTTDQAPTWPELLRSGASHAAGLMESNAEQWHQAIERLIDLGVGDPPHTGSLLLAAEGIQREIRSPANPGSYRDWLGKCFAHLSPQDRSVIELLCDLSPSLIATTNYDDLIEQVVRWDSYSLRTAEHLPEIQRVLRGERPAVLHLHGHYRTADSVVLGIRDYDEILEDAFARTLLRTLLLTRTLLFVGFGAGLDDPNFGGLLRWSEEVLAESDLPNFCLIRQGEPMVGDRPLRRVQLLEYGQDYDDLKAFLIELRNSAKVKEPKAVVPITGSEIVRPGDEIFVPDYSVSRDLADAIHGGVPLIVLHGALGSGRSQIARWLARSCQSGQDGFAGIFEDVLWLPARALWWNLAPETVGHFRDHNVLDYFALLAERLNRKSEASLSINEQVMRSIGDLTARRYLVILEGLDHVLEADGRLPDGFARLLRTPGRKSCVVITSQTVPQLADLTPETHPDQLAVIPVNDCASAQAKGYLEQFRNSRPDDTERARAIEDLVAAEGRPLPLVVVQWACGCPREGEVVRKVLKRARRPLALNTQRNLFARLVLDDLEDRERERVVLFGLALFAPPPTAASPTLRDLERVTGYPAAEVAQALEILSSRLLIWRDQRHGTYIHALTATCVLSAPTLRAGRAVDLKNNFVRWAVALAKEHNEWEMNGILTSSLLRHLDNLRVAYEVAMRLRPRHLRVDDRDMYVLGRTVGQALHMDGRWELGSFVLRSLHDHLPAGSGLQMLVRLLLARHQALQDEQGPLEEAERLCRSVLDGVEGLAARTPAEEAEKTEIEAEALMRLADARGRQPAAGPKQLAAVRQDLATAIAGGKFGIRVNATNLLAAVWTRMGEEPQLRGRMASKACFAQALEVLEGERGRLERSAWNRIKAQAARIRADAWLGLGVREKARAAYEEAQASSRNVVDERLRGWLTLIDARLSGNPKLAEDATVIFRQLRLHQEERRAQRFCEEIKRSPAPTDAAA